MIKIGELVKQHGISVDTLRFYEQQQLLRPSARSPAGYRLYNLADSQRLAFILRAKGVGFSLQQIRELLQIEDNISAIVSGLLVGKATEQTSPAAVPVKSCCAPKAAPALTEPVKPSCCGINANGLFARRRTGVYAGQPSHQYRHH